MSDDASDDGKWLTYQQLAEARRISKPSAIRLVMRHRWRRQRDNERVVRVLVPPDMLDPDRVSYDTPDDLSSDASSLAAGALAALEDAVGALREQLERAEAGREAERVRADALRARLDGLQAERDQSKRDAQAAQDQAESLRREDDTRKARGRWARIRAAWWGE